MIATYATKTVSQKEWDSWYSNLGSYVNLGSEGYGTNRGIRIGFLTVHLSPETKIVTPEEERWIKKAFAAMQYQFPTISEFQEKEKTRAGELEKQDEITMSSTELFENLTN